jgi:hypothetical protein
MQSVRFNCKTSLHLIVQPEEKHPGPLNDLNANDIWSALEDVTRNFGFQPLQMIDPMTAVKEGYVSLRRVLPLSEVKRYIFERPVSPG